MSEIRVIEYQTIVDRVADLCIRANMELPESLEKRIVDSRKQEDSPIALAAFEDMINNLRAARELGVPICQDTGMTVVFAEIGQDVHIRGGLFNDAVNEGVAKGYTRGLLRCSIVEDPLNRINTGNNTPAIIHTSLTEGDRIKITVAPKGFGSENMSRLKMLNPTDGEKEIIEFVTDTVTGAGSNPCPPVIVGVGIGGDFEYAALLAKKAVCRDAAIRNNKPYYAMLEKKLTEIINSTGIGPQGFGGKVTALAVNIETYPTHIAGLPVAVNIGCYVTRHKTSVI